MNQRRLFAAVGLAGALAVAACGAEDQVTKPAAQPANASQNAAEAFQHYYDVTHPAPKTKPANASQNAAEAFQHYYDVTRPVPKTKPAREPSGDADVYVPSVKPAREPSGDADVYVPSVKPAREPSGDADVYVPSVKPAREPSGDADVYVPSIVQPKVAALRSATSRNLEAQRVSMQVELAALAARDGLTGLSPAFLQRVEPCSGLSLASTSGCTTDELNAALPGNPR